MSVPLERTMSQKSPQYDGKLGELQIFEAGRYPKALNLLGETIERWKVVGYLGVNNWHHYWLCLCQCGNYGRVNQGNLTKRKSTSCGCAQRDLIAQRNRKTKVIHGHQVGVNDSSVQGRYSLRSPTYSTWVNLSGNKRGEVTEKWLGEGGFIRFLEEVGERPSKSYQLQRLKEDKRWEKSNVRWVLQRRKKKSTPQADATLLGVASQLT